MRLIVGLILGQHGFSVWPSLNEQLRELSSPTLGVSVVVLNNTEGVAVEGDSHGGNAEFSILQFSNVNQHQRSRVPLGRGRARSLLNVLVHNVSQAFREPKLHWLMDDDTDLNAEFSEGPAFQKGVCEAVVGEIYDSPVDALIGRRTGAPPLPVAVSTAGELGDLCRNVAWLSSMPPEQRMPNRANENCRVRAEFSEYYYDIHASHHHACELWLEPAFEGETCLEGLSRLSRKARRVRVGDLLVRRIMAPTVSGGLRLGGFSINRGGNFFVKKSESLVSFPNSWHSEGFEHVRRGDMLWCLVAANHGLVIRDAEVYTHHRRDMLAEKPWSVSDLCGEAEGYALLKAVEWLRKSRGIGGFSDAMFKEMLYVFDSTRADYVSRCQKNFLLIRSNAEKLIGLCDSLVFVPNGFPSEFYYRLRLAAIDLLEDFSEYRVMQFSPRSAADSEVETALRNAMKWFRNSSAALESEPFATFI